MNKRRIGRSGLVVSDICLGTMTFGSSCDKAEAFRIMDYAVDQGIDFFDTAEMYPVPPREEWVFRTEEIVGEWLKGKNRDGILIATKIAGPGVAWFEPPIRTGRTALDRHQIRKAIEGSLKRLGTDYVDLYQTHWPDHDFGYDETLEVLHELVVEGKVRYTGCSNEDSWGLMKSLSASASMGVSRYESIQNNFSIVNRRFEDELAEVCRREQVSLLPYSPLGGGVLTGKYSGGRYPDAARFSEYVKMGAERQLKMAARFVNEKSIAAADELGVLARELGISAAAFSLAWSKQHDFVASTIVGANTVAQLEDSLPAKDLILDESVLKQVDAITEKYMYPLG